MSELTQIVNNPEETQINSQINPETQITENLNKFVLKKGFKILPEQRRKILALPNKGFVSKIKQNTGDMVIPIDLLQSNQRELIDYLISLLYEKADSSSITENDFCEMETAEYKILEIEIKKVNPFGVFNNDNVDFKKANDENAKALLIGLYS